MRCWMLYIWAPRNIWEMLVNTEIPILLHLNTGSTLSHEDYCFRKILQRLKDAIILLILHFVPWPNYSIGIIEYECLPQWFLRCGGRASNISITWEFIRNANSRATPRPTESELYRWGPEIWALTSLLDDSNIQANLRTTALAQTS